MTTQYQRSLPTGHPLFSLPASASASLDKLSACSGPLLQLFSLAEQHIRQIARAEFELLLAEKVTAAAEADRNEQVLTVQQAAELIGVIPQTVYEWIKAGRLPSFIVGRNSIRLKHGDILAAIQAKTQPNGRRKHARRLRGTTTQKQAQGGACVC